MERKVHVTPESSQRGTGMASWRLSKTMGLMSTGLIDGNDNKRAGLIHISDQNEMPQFCSEDARQVESTARRTYDTVGGLFRN